MPQRRPFNQTRRKNSRGSAPPPREVPKMLVRSGPKQYGPPFILLEDDQKQTFEFTAGAWVGYHRSIAECRLDCQVTELAQKVNKMTRYEIRPELQTNS